MADPQRKQPSRKLNRTIGKNSGKQSKRPRQKQMLFIASDHAGFDLKTFLIDFILKELGPSRHLPFSLQWIDLGPPSRDRVDYPDWAQLLVSQMQNYKKGPARGLLICGTGIGMSIAANRFHGVRAAHAESEASARWARAHNDANVLCLGARITGPEHAAAILDTFLITPFEGGRHAQRIALLDHPQRSSS